MGRYTQKKRNRLHSIHNYLKSKFITPFPTRLIVIDPKDKKISQKIMGTSSRVKGSIYITIDGNLEYSRAAEVLAHEYSHAMTWTFKRLESVRAHHCDEWGLAYARVYRDLWEEGGLERIE